MTTWAININSSSLFQVGRPDFNLASPEGGHPEPVQTGKMVDRINPAHSLHWVAKKELADAMEGNQCDGSTAATDCGLVERGLYQK